MAIWANTVSLFIRLWTACNQGTAGCGTKIAFLFAPFSQYMYSNSYKDKDLETGQIMQLCTAKSRLGIKIADTHRLTPKETVNRHSPVNIYTQHCATYTQHLLLRAGVLVPSQGSTLHNSFCRRAKTKKTEWWHVGSMTQRQKIPQFMAFFFLHQLTYISSRLVWKKNP